MAEYIEREAVLKKLNKNSITKKITFADGLSIFDTIKNIPAADVVSIEVFEQVKWERDTALKTLEEHGIGLAQKADDVVKVVRCKDCEYGEADYGANGNIITPFQYHCEYEDTWNRPDHYCGYGKRK